VFELQGGHLLGGFRGRCLVCLRGLPCGRVLHRRSSGMLSVRSWHVYQCSRLCELYKLSGRYVFEFGRCELHNVCLWNIFFGPWSFKLQQLRRWHLRCHQRGCRLHQLRRRQLSTQRGPYLVRELRRWKVFGWHGSHKLSRLFRLRLWHVFGGGGGRVLEVRRWAVRGHLGRRGMRKLCDGHLLLSGRRRVHELSGGNLPGVSGRRGMHELSGRNVRNADGCGDLGELCPVRPWYLLSRRLRRVHELRRGSLPG
jgi:hypothetical protein